MYANVVTTEYKSPEDLETAVAQLTKLAESFDDAAGFKTIFMVRTGPAKTVHTVVFDTEANMVATRDRMFPIFKETVGPHVASPPVLEPGEVIIHRA